MPKRILIVDDDPAVRGELARLVESLDGQAVTSGSAADAIPRLGQPTPGFDLCLADLDLPAAGGTAVVLKARTCLPPVPTVGLTARGAGAVEALRAGATEIVA